MRRAIFAVLVTAAGLVLLLSFKPHDVASADRPPAAIAGATAGPQAEATQQSKGDGSGSPCRAARSPPWRPYSFQTPIPVT
jgi:hypothetical protein